VALYKTVFLDFLFKPRNAQNLLPDRLEMFAPTRGFSGDGRFNGIMQNVVGPTLVAVATKFGLKSPISRLAWQIDRRCLHLPGVFRGWPMDPQ